MKWRSSFLANLAASIVQKTISRSDFSSSTRNKLGVRENGFETKLNIDEKTYSWKINRMENTSWENCRRHKCNFSAMNSKRGKMFPWSNIHRICLGVMIFNTEMTASAAYSHICEQIYGIELCMTQLEIEKRVLLKI